MKKQKLTVAIIALNEEENLPRCLESVKNIADESVVVVDTRTVDRTAEIAKEYGARVYKRKFDDFASQKNYAAEKATNEWILSLDADEVVTPDLAKEIKLRIANLPAQTGCELRIAAFLIPRKNIILGAEIKHTRWSPDKHVWLWRKGKGKWKGVVHEEVEVDGRVGELKNVKIHYQYKTVAEFFKMINNYTEKEAEKILSSSEKFSYFKMFFAPARSFTGRFFYKKGFLDGWRGFILSYLMAIYRISVWIKVWEKNVKFASIVIANE
jgi:glycosyltransferase involved in cell wall biosynthesis